MKYPAIARFESRRTPGARGRSERGVTILLVAVAIVAIMGMAALSIDVITLYLANAEAQRSADAAALAAARILSISGVTGDPANSPTSGGTNAWQLACQMATQVATAIAQQNTVGGIAVPAGQVTVTYPNNTDTATCSGTDTAFGVNPLVTVRVQRTSLPTFFARIWNQKGASVSGTATAEAFNGSNSEVWGNGPNGTLIPVQPRCVKPWLIPNSDPDHAGGPFILGADGSIQNSGIGLSGSGTPTQVIGESFSLTADCTETGKPPQTCKPGSLPDNPPISNPAAATTEFVPAYVNAQPIASMSCAPSSPPFYGPAIAGCDQTTVYACGVVGGSSADLTINGTPDTAPAASCLINQAVGSDFLKTTVYPYQIEAGFGNPFVQAGVVQSSHVVTSSNNIATIPIFTVPGPMATGTQAPVTVVGFLQAFINNVGGATGTDVNVTVLNVVGCGDGSKTPVGTPVIGSSPVPVRLVQKYP